MIKKTKGIVLRTIKYRESSLICQIYTLEMGLRSYIVSGVKSSKGRSKSAYFHPLSILRLVVYDKENADLNRIKEFELDTVFQNIPFDVVKGACALFMTEVLRSVLIEKNSNTEVYAFVEKQIHILEHATSRQLTVAPLLFLIGLADVLGFCPDGRDYKEDSFLDMREGLFVMHTPLHTDYFDKEESKAISQMLSVHHDIAQLELKKSIRNVLRAKLLQYFKVHIDSFRDIQSDKILSQVL